MANQHAVFALCAAQAKMAENDLLIAIYEK